jgi:hypothetical protein
MNGGRTGRNRYNSVIYTLSIKFEGDSAPAEERRACRESRIRIWKTES